ncbi:hypothetical protein BC332_01149, partial [Capsicum chinense]
MKQLLLLMLELMLSFRKPYAKNLSHAPCSSLLTVLNTIIDCDRIPLLDSGQIEIEDEDNILKKTKNAVITLQGVLEGKHDKDIEETLDHYQVSKDRWWSSLYKMVEGSSAISVQFSCCNDLLIKYTLFKSRDDEGGGVLSDVSPMQKVVAEFDEWEMDGGEEKMMVNVGEPLLRVVSGGAPSLQEATEATSDLKHALKKVYLSGSANEDGGSCESGSSSSPYSKACVVSETVVIKSAPKHATQAFMFLNETPAAQSVVDSIACDPNVWNAVMQNPSLQEFLGSQKT